MAWYGLILTLCSIVLIAIATQYPAVAVTPLLVGGIVWWVMSKIRDT